MLGPVAKELAVSDQLQACECCVCSVSARTTVAGQGRIRQSVPAKTTLLQSSSVTAYSNLPKSSGL